MQDPTGQLHIYLAVLLRDPGSQVTLPMPYLPRHFLDAAIAVVVPNTAGSNGRVPGSGAAGWLELAQ